MLQQSTSEALTSKPTSTRPRTPLLVHMALAYLAVFVTTAAVAQFIIPYDPAAIDLKARLSPPIGWGGSLAHPFGTDELGRDMLSRLVLSIQMSVSIGLGATGLGAMVGTSLGFIAAHLRGWIEQAILALIDFQATMPFLILALAVLAFIGNSLAVFVCLLALHGWERYARIARSLAISANAQGYASAVRQLGAHPLHVYWRHILPNVAATLIVSMTISFPEIILVESGLSFLGLGVQPPSTSLGAMVGYGRDYLARAPWVLMMPSLVISLMALSVSLIGDWLRDRFDGTLR
ncbi:Glutathione transport system permease protein GsiD [Bradyrhizobium ivorense]|uniref:Glutathione transport system permease protein GsiD n=1 Tax=Bradyrhizobium ivorense TaxID=2511166 RepID=A0A508TCU5_9BRAD|nr:Glutathione transport system permease protein GsiD [Bradyrhizobium ivorense]